MKRLILTLALVLMLLIPNAALASDKPPPDAPTPTPEQMWFLKANYGWDMYQRGWIASPCENDAFVDLYGEWFGC